MFTRCLFRIAVAWLPQLSLVEQEAPAVRVAPPPPLHPPARPPILARTRTMATMVTETDMIHTMTSRPQGLMAPGPSRSVVQAQVLAEK